MAITSSQRTKAVMLARTRWWAAVCWSWRASNFLIMVTWARQERIVGKPCKDELARDSTGLLAAKNNGGVLGKQIAS